ncbi:ficolin-3-like [Sabethes cyaneus]|uniref:ficolin-3-like n=1 Tax=Sabethes cyaneus TaxID=53552 RepID=UPI00237D5ED3|nr:ficolin-3-like [Sabethes cyaneus]
MIAFGPFTILLVLALILSKSTSALDYRSCNDVPAVSGIYSIRPLGTTTLFQVYCEQEQFGGRWLVIQNRYDGSENFNRSWTDYQNGFGNLQGEFWLGLEKIHQITLVDEHEMFVWIGDFNDFEATQKYRFFEVADELDNFRLSLDGWRDGTAGESFYVYRDKPFSTYDRDHDNSILNCAKEMGSGYWHFDCGTGVNRNNLNGEYSDKILGKKRGMWWGGFGAEKNPLKWSRMMIRTRVY